MSVTYTNNKGRVYYLYQGVTKTGKPHYYFARELKDEPVEAIPEGYVIRESVNGRVSLARETKVYIQPKEPDLVQAAIKRHPKARNYRCDVKGKRIAVYESTAPDGENLLPVFQRLGRGLEDLQAYLDSTARFTPVMRFTLLDEKKRIFQAERWCYLGSIDDWIDIGSAGRVRRLARKYIPLLGTHKLFEIL